MSNLLVNIRFGLWHFQIARDWPWFSWTRNDYHVEGLASGRTPWFEVCQPFRMTLGGRP